jgi:hypothetical protein
MVGDDPEKEAKSNTETRDEVQAADQTLPFPGRLSGYDSLIQH